MGAYALVGGLVSLTAWAADIPRLADWHGSGISIQPNAAVAVTTAALAALLLSRRFAYLTLVLGIFIVVIGVATLFEIVTNIDLSIDTVLMFGREWGQAGVISRGRMGTPASTSWTLIGTSVALISLSQIRDRALYTLRIRTIASGLAITALAISSLSITGYLYGAETLYTLPRFTLIAFQTATFIAAISLAILLQMPDVGPMRLLSEASATGLMFRRIVPMLITLPILLGLFQLTGERVGFYDRPFGLAAGTLIEVVVLLALLWWNGRAVSRAHKELEAARDELELRVEERTVEIMASNLALCRSNYELEQFASVASHDLQEPLRKIQAFGDRLQTKYAAGLGEQGQTYVDRMLISAARMRSLIDSLLDFSRITTKTNPFVPVDLAKVARECVSDLEIRISETAGRVEIGPLGAIDADPIQMHQLFLNLIGNGLKFNRPDQPPVVQVESRILKGSPKNAAMCEITVRDNGIGFEEIYLDRIFEVFQRLHGRQEYKGTGRGLAICRKIAERHGGSITAKSELNAGSTFLVTLPLKQEETK